VGLAVTHCLCVCAEMLGFTTTKLVEMSPWAEHWSWFKPKCGSIMTVHGDKNPIPDTCVPI